jgi:3-oxoacyl-[acyl-carrier protein] reductase
MIVYDGVMAGDLLFNPNLRHKSGENVSRTLALITGGTSGIGYGIARCLASNYDLALVYSSNHLRAAEARKSLISEFSQTVANLKVEIYAKNLVHPNDCDSVVEQIRNDFEKPVDVLVNSAGRIRDQLFTVSRFEDHEMIMAEHLLIPMKMCHLVIQDMSRAKHGRIINIGSIAALRAKAGQTSYAAAKAGLEAFSRNLALEVGRRGVTVNVVAPGMIETPMTQHLLVNREEITKQIPVGFVGQPDDIGGTVRFLCSGEARFITGSVITVDGGRSVG